MAPCVLQGEDTGSDGPDEEREDGEANEAAEEEERERQRRIEESLRKREEEVQRALAGHLRDRDKERMQHKHDEAVHNFNALLADLVSSTFETTMFLAREIFSYLLHTSV